jgi:hypothetical protein
MRRQLSGKLWWKNVSFSGFLFVYNVIYILHKIQKYYIMLYYIILYIYMCVCVYMVYFPVCGWARRKHIWFAQNVGWITSPSNTAKWIIYLFICLSVYLSINLSIYLSNLI